MDELTDRSLRYSVKDLYYTYESVDLKTRQDAILFLEFARALGIPPNIGVNRPESPQKNVSILEEVDTDPTDTGPEPSAPPENPYSFAIVNETNNDRLYLSVAQTNLLLSEIEREGGQKMKLYMFLQMYQRDIREKRTSHLVVQVNEANFNRVKEILGVDTFPSA